jgi:DNA repair protein RadC
MGSYLPREKLEKTGLSGLTDTELMAVVLGSGTKNKSYMKLSKEVVGIIKNSKQHLLYKNFEKLNGIGKVKAMRIASGLELGRRIYGSDFRKMIKSREDVVGIVEYLRNKKQEYAVVLYLDARNRLIMEKTVAIGSANMLIVEPRDIFSTAMKNGASAIILVHNHPSGDNSPSRADIEFTKRVKKAGLLLGVDLIDHVIV